MVCSSFISFSSTSGKYAFQTSYRLSLSESSLNFIAIVIQLSCFLPLTDNFNSFQWLAANKKTRHHYYVHVWRLPNHLDPNRVQCLFYG